ncbi:MAG: CHAT domain-containing protein [Acidobacteria bacterium]|nr:CHAT domain-containing protein [Acidobacteriota bacterium]
MTVVRLIGICTALAAQPDAHVLVVDERIERAISPGEVHSYRVDARAGEFVRVTLEGRGALLRLSGSGAARERGAGDMGPMIWSRVSAGAETYELRIESRDSEPRTYVVALTGQRQAATGDNVRVAAEDALARGEIVERENGHAALALYLESERLFSSVNDVQGRADALIHRGQALSALGQNKEASDVWRRALEHVREIRDEAGEATALFRLGRLYGVTGRPNEAQEALDGALAIRERHGDLARQAETLVELAGVAGVRSESDRALALLDRALRLARAAGDRRGTADALNHSGVVHAYLGRTREAVEAYREALAIRERIRFTEGQGQTLNNLGVIHYNLGEARAAIGYYQRAVELRRAGGNLPGALTPLYNLGNAHAELGEQDRAIALFREAAAGFRTAGARRGEAFCLQALGDSLLALGDNERASEHFEKARASWEALEDRRGETLALIRLGTVFQSTNRLTKAREVVERAVALSSEKGYQRELSQALVKRGAIQHALDQREAAESSFNRALGIGRAISDPRSEASALTGLGDLAFHSGDASKSAVLYREALVLRESSGDRPSEATLHARLARGYRQSGDLTAARADILATLDLIESMRAGLSSDDLRMSYAASSRAHYELAIDVLMDMHAREPGRGFDAEAFHVSERARARSLLEMLAQGKIELREGAASAAELLSEERELQDLINGKAARLTRLVAARHTKEQAEAARRELRDLLTRQSELRGRIRTSHSRYGALTQPVPITAAEARETLLGGGAVLLEYWLGEERSILWVLTKSTLKTHRLPARAHIEELVNEACGALAEAGQVVSGETAAAGRARVARSEARFRVRANELSRVLLTPAGEHLEAERLVIVAHRGLARLPFAALPSPRRSGEILGERAAITNQPSASVSAFLRQQTRPDRKISAIAIIADPVFTASDSRVHSISGGTVEFPPQAVEYPRLRFSREEALAIAGLHASRATLLALDFDASRKTVLSGVLARRPMIHFATHTLLNDRQPELSGIVLSQVDRQGKPVDGFLRLHEIYNLKLDARLVVLSACQSGLGRHVEGEGLIGLVRGFLHAGADAVLASLWNVDDRATAAFMGYFYRALLKQRMPPSEALKIARRKMQSEERWRHPYYWSTFVLIGDSR